jgi:hypothetical protein
VIIGFKIQNTIGKLSSQNTAVVNRPGIAGGSNS